MWSWLLVCGLFADNVVLMGILFAVNVVRKQPLFAVHGVYVCGPLQLLILLEAFHTKPHCEHDENFKNHFFTLLDRHVEREQDRALLGLAPKAKNNEK